VIHRAEQISTTNGRVTVRRSPLLQHAFPVDIRKALKQHRQV
jgi:hypothetical protein